MRQNVDAPKEAPAEEPSAPIEAEVALDRTVLPIPEPEPPLYIAVEEAAP